ncbi:unnamed protein product [Lactuca virosa]|uniref:Calmodulin-binding family protein n=1 Tax=Lactuca virosa TaxID=75947 RepID=A0AAU9PQP9_9ASTR|nr:unnamed protein product [Lactuca virosa]
MGVKWKLLFPVYSSTKEEHIPAKTFESQMTESNMVGPESPLPEPLMDRDLAALKLQKTYKSFRTRRQLADCAILVEHRWWKLLDFAVLKCSSVSFFEIEKPETAVSRWSRARTRAAKVGKGLSHHAKACKLALQHWLEAIDPRHRYGHNLHFYYVKWLHCESKQPFFYWLDIGEGKEVNHERCPRSKLQQQCIKYLSPIEREDFEATVEDGKFIYKLSRKLIDTREPTGVKWIFVLSTSNILYVGMKLKGKFQHSSFLAGGATLSAGRLVVVDGILKAVWPHSGHYLPTKENFEAFISFLEQHQINIQTIKKSPDGDEEVPNEKMTGYEMRNSVSEPDFSRATEETESKYRNDSKPQRERERSGTCPPFSNPKITTLEIPTKEDIILSFQTSESQMGPTPEPEPEPEPEPSHSSDEGDDHDETAEKLLSSIELMVSKRNLFDSGEEGYEFPVSEEKIMERINSHKETKSFQLAKQLSCRWTTGVGPRIGCVRDYPTELQFRALEVCLSPKNSLWRLGFKNCEISNRRKKSYSLANIEEFSRSHHSLD